MLDWAEIDTVLLDMDGTLLDLHFDNHFWLEHLPRRWSEISGISLADAKGQLKSEYAELNGKIQWYCLDTLISTHEFGVTKESWALWQKLQQRLGFKNETTLFVDDSLPILTAAQNFGIKHLLAVANPDSQQQARTIDDFPAITDYTPLLADILAHSKLRSVAD